MKIAFTGAQGTGKTTAMYDMASKLKKDGYSVSIVQETARDCPMEINQQTTTDAQYWIAFEQMRREVEKASTSDIVLTDRSIVDVYAYYLYGHHPQDFWSNLVDGWAETYHHIIYMEPNDDYLKEDGVRATDRKFRDDIDSLIQGILGELKIPVYEFESVDKTINEVIEHAEIR